MRLAARKRNCEHNYGENLQDNQLGSTHAVVGFDRIRFHFIKSRAPSVTDSRSTGRRYYWADLEATHYRSIFQSTRYP